MYKVKRVLVMLMMVVAMIFVLAGCVAVRDSIPIMGENADGTQVIVSHATRTRFYALSKAAEKLDLWEVSSDAGVKMKGSDSSSDGTASVAMFERGFELAAARYGLAAPGAGKAAQGQPDVSGDDGVQTISQIVRKPLELRTVASGEGAKIQVIILGNRSTCGYCSALWAGLDAAALSAALCEASVIDADASANPGDYAKYKPDGPFSYPLVVVYENGTRKGQFVARGYSQGRLVSEIRALAPSCASQ